MRLFAIVKQFSAGVGSDENAKDIVRTFLMEYTNPAEVSVFLDIYEYHKNLFEKKESSTKRQSLFSVKATIICTNIVEELPKKIRIHLIISILEIIRFKGVIARESYDLVRTFCTLFNISLEELSDMLAFVDLDREYIGENILVVSSNENPNRNGKKHIYEPQLTGELYVLFNRATYTMFFYHIGENEFFLRNSNPINSNRIHLFKMGGVIENYKIQPLFYSTLQSYFGILEKPYSIELVVDRLSYNFPDGTIAIHPLSFTIKSGELVGIMGNSGTGKSTLLNVLAGTLQPTSGRVLINGHDWYSLGKNLYPYVGFIPQDDQLIKELTVYQNLYFTAQLSFQNKTHEETEKLVQATLEELGLDEIKNLRVGTPEKSIISGGQRKRLNMALEFLRKPQILFIDEPTSGLSSTDSERVLDIIKTQTQQGRLALVNIHQPSSNAFKIFDKILILDQGGRAVFFGNPIDSILHLKTSISQVNSMERECQSCGNVNTEQILDIIEKKKLRSDGLPTEHRRYTPESWYRIYMETVNDTDINIPQRTLPEQTFDKVTKFRQFTIYVKRNFISMFADKQFLLISFLEAPLLAFIFAFLTKNFGGNDFNSSYSFFYNQNIPAYFLMSVVVAMFFGLMFGAERIIRDRHILQREKFLGLSRLAYINSKIFGLFVFLTIQITLFVITGNLILGIKGNGLSMWFILLSIAINGGVLGLNLSSGLRTSVAIYISIPLLIMPQLLLNGSLIPFDKLHRSIASHQNVPLVADIAVSRWGYEALMVNQFSNNRYQKIYFDIDKQESELRYLNGYLIPEIEQVIREYNRLAERGDFATAERRKELIVNGLNLFGGNHKLLETVQLFAKNTTYPDTLLFQLKVLKRFVAKDIRNLNETRNQITGLAVKNLSGVDGLIAMKEEYTNEAVGDFVLGRRETTKIIRTETNYIRKFEPIYMMPTSKWGNSHLFSTQKNVGGLIIDTLWFNLTIIWLISLLLYVALYFDWIKKIIAFVWGK